MPPRSGDLRRILQPNVCLNQKSPLQGSIFFASTEVVRRPRSDSPLYFSIESFPPKLLSSQETSHPGQLALRWDFLFFFLWGRKSDSPPVLIGGLSPGNSDPVAVATRTRLSSLEDRWLLSPRHKFVAGLHSWAIKLWVSRLRKCRKTSAQLIPIGRDRQGLSHQEKYTRYTVVC